VWGGATPPKARLAGQIIWIGRANHLVWQGNAIFLMIESRVIKQLSGFIDLKFTEIGSQNVSFWQVLTGICPKKIFFLTLNVRKKHFLTLFFECPENFF
jgi:hypothetical protein